MKYEFRSKVKTTIIQKRTAAKRDGTLKSIFYLIIYDKKNKIK